MRRSGRLAQSSAARIYASPPPECGRVHAVITMFTQRKVQSSPTRRPILIVDDHPLVRRRLKAVIDAEPDLIVCGEAATREDGLRAIAAARPDWVVVDPSLARGDGLELI